jgi:hypothetical protein
MTIENYKELYTLSKEVFDSELDRFYQVEQKASQYLSVLTILLGAASFFLKWLFENFIPPRNPFEGSLVVLAAGIIISLLVSWFALFSSFKVHNVNIIPLNSLWIEFFAKNRLVDIYYHLSVRMKEGREQNRRVLNQKGRWMHLGYNSMRLAVICLVIFGLVFAAYKWRQPKTEKLRLTIELESNQNGQGK